MQKALAARIPVVAAVSAPSSLTATFAREGGRSLSHQTAPRLSPGQHTIEFGGTGTLGPFSLDIKYTITVLPKGQYKKLSVPQPVTAGQGTFSSGPSLASSFFESDDRLLG